MHSDEFAQCLQEGPARLLGEAQVVDRTPQLHAHALGASPPAAQPPLGANPSARPRSAWTNASVSSCRSLAIRRRSISRTSPSRSCARVRSTAPASTLETDCTTDVRLRERPPARRDAL